MITPLTDKQRADLQGASMCLITGAREVVGTGSIYATTLSAQAAHNHDAAIRRMHRDALRYAAKRLEATGRFPSAVKLLVAISEGSEP